MGTKKKVRGREKVPRTREEEKAEVGIMARTLEGLLTGALMHHLFAKCEKQIFFFPRSSHSKERNFHSTDLFAESKYFPA